MLLAYPSSAGRAGEPSGVVTAHLVESISPLISGNSGAVNDRDLSPPGRGRGAPLPAAVWAPSSVAAHPQVDKRPIKGEGVRVGLDLQNLTAASRLAESPRRPLRPLR